MATKKDTRQKLKKEFEAARAEYVALQKKWERSRVKAQRRENKMRKLSVQIAELEQQMHGQQQGVEPVKVKTAELRRARLIFKPNEDGPDAAAQLKDIEDRLRAHGIMAQTVLKTSGKQVRAVAKEAADAKEELLVVAAGDGTIEDAASQLILSKTTLGIIPIGTMNNLARALGIPLNVEDACALLGMGLTHEIDAGKVKTDSEADHVEHFLETAGLGLSAIAIPAGQAAEKGRWTMLPGALKKLFSHTPANLSVELDDGRVLAAHSEVVTVSNSPMMGNNILIAPDAKMDDGLLDIAIFDGMGKTDLVSYFMAASNGKRANDQRVTFQRAKHVRITSDKPIDAHSDKDVLPEKQVLDIEIVPKALRVVAGKGIGLTTPLDAVPSQPPLTGPQAPEHKPVEAANQDQPHGEKSAATG